MTHEYRFCPRCATPLSVVAQMEDGGEKARLRCPACDFTHWNNPTPVLAAVIEYDGQILLARNAAWPGRMFALITGFMEAAGFDVAVHASPVPGVEEKWFIGKKREEVSSPSWRIPEKK